MVIIVDNLWISGRERDQGPKLVSLVDSCYNNDCKTQLSPRMVLLHQFPPLQILYSLLKLIRILFHYYDYLSPYYYYTYINIASAKIRRSE